MNTRLPILDELRVVVRQNGFRVKALASHVGLDVRTLERRFELQFRTTPKEWIKRERMSMAPPLLGDGLSNKEVAASLSYTRESNFCRAFKQYFGCAPQQFARSCCLSPFDNELSRTDKRGELRTTRDSDKAAFMRVCGFSIQNLATSISHPRA